MNRINKALMATIDREFGPEGQILLNRLLSDFPEKFRLLLTKRAEIVPIAVAPEPAKKERGFPLDAESPFNRSSGSVGGCVGPGTDPQPGQWVEVKETATSVSYELRQSPDFDSPISRL